MSPVSSPVKGTVNLGAHFDAAVDSFAALEEPLVPLPPPLPFRQGYEQGTYPENPDIFVQGCIQPGSTSPTQGFQESIDDFEKNVGGFPSTNVPYRTTTPSRAPSAGSPPPPRTFRGRRWPPSPSLGQAARARLSPGFRMEEEEEDLDNEDFVGPNGLVLKTLKPCKNPKIPTKCTSKYTQPDASVSTRISVTQGLRTPGKSATSSV